MTSVARVTSARSHKSAYPCAIAAPPTSSYPSQDSSCRFRRLHLRHGV
ncbi:hypothetical protein [Anabaena azotica]|uniref:Uncharacterized protein n=1 Tax=Anabaena azotica FACHB-119 TaxID=947527 RepID=A0ABR8DH24_9NOST|nr:hypothetical protein [Anabaena azotica]MBD2505492.1 hypothetical protein [Anabaena azotica FACHB-119]